jgi:Type IV secretory pathway, protease TraF|nr:S26 family signal peptidase [uncultured Ferrovibrio sp.]
MHRRAISLADGLIVLPRRRRAGYRRWLILLLMLLGLLLLAGALFQPKAPAVVWNASSSLPRGLYITLPASRIGHGDVVLAELPSPWTELAARRGYLLTDIPLIKEVAAMVGDQVCGHGQQLMVGGRSYPRQSYDALGRPLPVWQGCRFLAEDEILLLAAHALSFDSRYFGPLPMAAIKARLRPLLILAEHEPDRS